MSSNMSEISEQVHHKPSFHQSSVPHYQQQFETDQKQSQLLQLPTNPPVDDELLRRYGERQKDGVNDFFRVIGIGKAFDI